MMMMMMSEHSSPAANQLLSRSLVARLISSSALPPHAPAGTVLVLQARRVQNAMPAQC
jgi:hypothetical protein